jgi:hypothetical protein
MTASSSSRIRGSSKHGQDLVSDEDASTLTTILSESSSFGASDDCSSSSSSSSSFHPPPKNNRSTLRALEKEYFKAKKGRFLSSLTEASEKSSISGDLVADKAQASIKIRPLSLIKKKRSSMKKILPEDSTNYINEKGPWKRLPKPDLGWIRSQSMNMLASSDFELTNDSPSRGHSVQFDSVQVRLYAQTLGDNPAVSHGAPIQLDWSYEEEPDVDINIFEGDRRPRKIRQMILSSYHRQNILMHRWNHSEKEVKDAKREVKKIKRQRFTTAFLSDLVLF